MHPIKIAIVEDEAIIASLLHKSLEKLGYNIVGLAVNYAEAVELLHENCPDIIFLDIRMPDLDGFEFLQEFSELPQRVLELCKIIMLSSTIDPIELEKARNSPFVLAFIPKPLTRDKIIELFE